MIDSVEVEQRRLERLDSAERIAWLRARIRATFIDCALRSYFRRGPPENRSWKEYAIEIAVGPALVRGMSMLEITVAVKAEWASGIDIAVKIGERLEIIAFTHLKYGGTENAIHLAFKNARRKFPEAWPWLDDDLLEAVSGGFRRSTRYRRAG